MLAQLPAWSECLFDPDPRYLAIRGGRGSSKSRSVATALVLRAARGTLRVLCAREIQDSIKDSVKLVLDDEIARLGLGNFFTSTQTEIRGANGSLFLFAGLRSNVSSIKSMEGIDVCWVEEAQSVSRHSLDVLVPTIRQPGSQLIFTWNPLNEYDAVEVMFADGNCPPRTRKVEVNYVDNPWFPDELRELMEHHRATDLEKYAHVWLGHFKKRSDALVFKNWRVEAFEAPPTAHHRFGADWGFAQDPTVLIRAHLSPNGRALYVDYEAWAIGCETINLPDLFMSVPESEKWPCVADSSRPETISHMRKHGFKHMYPSVKGPGSVEHGIDFLRGLELVVHPRCVHVIDELARYSHKVDEADRVLPGFVDKDNHTIDALRYACESARRTAQAKPVAVTPLPTANRWSRHAS